MILALGTCSMDCPALGRPSDLKLATKASRASRAHYIETVSFVYFSSTLVLAIPNVVIIMVGAEYYQVLLFGMERALYTTLACRIILNLRAAARRAETTVEQEKTNGLIEFNHEGELGQSAPNLATVP
ncbi:hypothetical protein AURDEDRAFT_166707 [Auricularia subglabra TFB-10046 SS5]|nr:hypothetical protein AURDEDRAFT_166707 [Auricularia subglabra TFB-10046 SS5]